MTEIFSLTIKHNTMHCYRDGQQKYIMKHRLIQLLMGKDNHINQQVRKVDKSWIEKCGCKKSTFPNFN